MKRGTVTSVNYSYLCSGPQLSRFPQPPILALHGRKIRSTVQVAQAMNHGTVYYRALTILMMIPSGLLLPSLKILRVIVRAFLLIH